MNSNQPAKVPVRPKFTTHATHPNCITSASGRRIFVGLNCRNPHLGMQHSCQTALSTWFVPEASKGHTVLGAIEGGYTSGIVLKPSTTALCTYRRMNGLSN